MQNKVCKHDFKYANYYSLHVYLFPALFSSSATYRNADVPHPIVAVEIARVVRRHAHAEAVRRRAHRRDRPERHLITKALFGVVLHAFSLQFAIKIGAHLADKVGRDDDIVEDRVVGERLVRRRLDNKRDLDVMGQSFCAAEAR